MLTDTLTVTEAKKIWRYEKMEDGVCILGYKGRETDVETPSAIGKDKVTAIGNYAFSPKASHLTEAQREQRRQICSIALPETITKIGETAFEGCENLTIHAPAGSYAEKYAKKNDIRFIEE